VVGAWPVGVKPLNRQGAVNLKITNEQIVVGFVGRLEDGRGQAEGDTHCGVNKQDEGRAKPLAGR
jgi:hypothetical protein